MRMYILRHGMSFANQQHMVSGSQDTPLTDLGRRQVKLAAQNARIFDFDGIVSSPLSRAYESACIIADELGYPRSKIVVLDDLTERHLGAAEGRPYEAVHTASPNIEDIEGDATIEPIEVFFARAERVLAHLKRLPAKRVLIVCHNGIGRMLRVVATEGQPLDLYKQPRLSHAIIYKLL